MQRGRPEADVRNVNFDRSTCWTLSRYGLFRWTCERYWQRPILNSGIAWHLGSSREILDKLRYLSKNASFSGWMFRCYGQYVRHCGGDVSRTLGIGITSIWWRCLLCNIYVFIRTVPTNVPIFVLSKRRKKTVRLWHGFLSRPCRHNIVP